MKPIQFVCPSCGRIHETMPEKDLFFYTCENCKQDFLMNPFGVEMPLGRNDKELLLNTPVHKDHKIKCGKGEPVMMACGKPANHQVGTLHLYLPPEETLEKFFDRVDPFAEKLSLEVLIRSMYPEDYWTIDKKFKEKYHEIFD